MIPVSRTGRSRAARITTTVACAVLVTLGACDAPSAVRPLYDYDPTTLSEGRAYRWRSGSTIRVWTDLSDSTGLVDLGRSVRGAIAAWNTVPSFREFRLELVRDVAAADLLVYDLYRPSPIQPGSCTFSGAGIGYTYFCPTTGTPAGVEPLRLASGAQSQARVVIRVDKSRVNGQAGYDALVAHEFGHALGIGGHSDVSSDLMFGLPTALAPTSRDARTLQYVMGLRPDILF